MKALQLMLFVLCHAMGQPNPVDPGKCEAQVLDGITAIQRHDLTKQGCVSQVSRQEVYVLNVIGSGMVLNVEVTGMDKQRRSDLPAVLVINMKGHMLNMTVTGFPAPLTVHYPDQIFFMATNPPTSNKEKNLPADSEGLLQWAQEKYGEVTAFSELQDPQTIYLNVGRDLGTRTSCVLQENFRSTGILESEFLATEVSGCQISGSSSMKKAYILHVTHPFPKPSSTPIKVKVDATNDPCAVGDENMVFLKSEEVYSWLIQSKHSFKIEASGEYKIQAFGDYMLQGVTLPDTKESLISYVLDKGFKSILYLELADSISVTVPMACVAKEGNTAPPTMSTQKTVQLVYCTKCNDTHMEVTLEKTFFQAHNTTEITLEDPDCKAMDNGDSFKLMTSSEGCATKKDETGLHNTLQIKAPALPFSMPISCSPPLVQLELFDSPEFNTTVTVLQTDKAAYGKVSASMEPCKPVQLTECFLQVEGERQVVSAVRQLVDSNTMRTWTFHLEHRALPDTASRLGELICTLCLSEKASPPECPPQSLLQSSLTVTITRLGSTDRDVGLGMASVLGITFGAFLIGALLTAALWYIYMHTRSSNKMQPGPAMTRESESSSTNPSMGSTQSTPCSTSSRA